MDRFSEQRAERLLAGQRTHKNAWAQWSYNKFIDEALEELVDCANYIDKGGILCSNKVIKQIKEIYDKLTSLKK